MLKPSRSQLAAYAAQQWLEKPQDRQELIDQIAALLITDGRKHQVELVIKDINQALYAQHGILVVNVYSKNKLNKDNLSNIEQLLNSRFSPKEIIINQHLDETIIAGVLIKALDTDIDLTANHKLNLLKASS